MIRRKKRGNLPVPSAARLLLGTVVLALIAACGAPAVAPSATDPAPAHTATVPAPTAAPVAATATPASTVPQLRVKNNGPNPIEGLVVIFPEDRVEFGDVPVGATTEYKDVPHGVYRYAAYQLVVDGEGLDLPVMDWMGELPVPGQAFTYVLDFDPSRGEWEQLWLVEATVDR